MKNDGNPENSSNPKNPGLTALVLAGRRGPKDRLAHTVGQSHKACIAVAGVPMIVRVLTSLRAVGLVQDIVVSIDEAAVLADCVKVRGVRFHASQSSPAASVLDYFETHGAQGPVLVTTADHALLTPAMVEYFCAAAQHSDADVVIGVVSVSLFRAQYPESHRTFLPLADGSWSGTNLFLLRTPQAGAGGSVLGARRTVSEAALAAGEYVWIGKSAPLSPSSARPLYGSGPGFPRPGGTGRPGRDAVCRSGY